MLSGKSGRQKSFIARRQLLSGLLLIFAGVLLFGFSFWKLLGHAVWESSFALERSIQSPIIQLQPGAQSRIGVYLRVESVLPAPPQESSRYSPAGNVAESAQRAPDDQLSTNPSQKKLTQYAFPLRYQVMDSQDRIIHTERTAVSNEGEKAWISRARGLESGTHLYEIFRAPVDGQISLRFELSSRDNFQAAEATDAKIRVFDRVSAWAIVWPLLLLSTLLMVIGIFLAVCA